MEMIANITRAQSECVRYVEEESSWDKPKDISEFKTLLQSCHDNWVIGEHIIASDDSPEDRYLDTEENHYPTVVFDIKQGSTPYVSPASPNLYSKVPTYSEADDLLAKSDAVQNEARLAEIGLSDHKDDDVTSLKLRFDLISEGGKPSAADPPCIRSGMSGVRVGDTIAEISQARCYGAEVDGTWMPSLKKFIHYHHHQGVQHAQLRLPHGIAGAVQLQLSLDAEQLKLHLFVENMPMREALEGSLTQLRQSLLASGLQLTQSAIDLYHSDTSYFSNKKQQKNEDLSEGNKSNKEDNDVVYQYEKPLFQRFSAII